MAKHEINTINQTSKIPVKNGSRNVFANLGLCDADDLQVKAELTR